VERARFDKLLSSQEIAALITALGTGIGKDEYKPEKLRYHRIIIMTDADVDGAHIERDPTSEGWRLRLEKVVHGNKVETIIDHAFLESGDYAQIVKTAQTLTGLIQADAQVKRGETVRSIRSFKDGLDWLLSEAKGGMAIQRYKGLGEMNPEQLWETTMDPAKRVLLKVQIEDAISAGEIFSTLMGDEVEPRRQFIESNALGVTNLDV
jgi:DNA gyrase subunit B